MYEVTLSLSSNRLRVVSDGGLREVQYNGRTLDSYSACAGAALGSFVVEVEEDGQAVVYTIVLLGGSAPSCFVGRNGELIFSDAPGHEIDRTDGAHGPGPASTRRSERAPRPTPPARRGSCR